MSSCPFKFTRRASLGGFQDGTLTEDKDFEICCTKTYAQTLFLGCSIKSFNVSLGWGSEATRLTVELIVDKCSYPTQQDKDGNPVEVGEYNHYTNNLINNTFQKDNNGNSLIPGKVYYMFDAGSNTIVSDYWLEPDPGFYGEMQNPNESIELVGSPVFFKYDYFEFAGIVKNWERSGGQSGSLSYTVIIEVPTFLLSQTQMILGDYSGSIHTKWSNSIYGTPTHRAGNYIGDIYEQNLPNVINIYGFLEDITPYDTPRGATPTGPEGVPAYSYGASTRTDEGIPAGKIIEGIIGLLDSIDPLNKDKVLRYSPFGRMVGPAHKIKNTHSDVNWDHQTGDKPMYKMGTVPGHSYPSNSNQKRTLYTLDVSALSYWTTYRISENKMSIMDFAQNLADHFGFKIFVSMGFIFENGIMYPRLYFNSISTRVQPPDGAIANFTRTLYNLGLPLTQYSTGEEYNDNNAKRTMIIGGKQQRLYQVKNTKYSSTRSTLRYNPYTNQFLSNPQQGSMAIQSYRFANPDSTRSPALYSTWSPALAIGRVDLPLVSDFDSPNLWQTVTEVQTTNVKRGNYYPVTRLPIVGAYTNGEYPAASSDSICPYFGNNIITGLVRNVTFHVRNSQHGLGFMVHFTTDELKIATGIKEDSDWIGGIGNQIVRISETEIRAAMKGLDAFVGLISAILEDGKRMFGYSFTFDLYDKYLLPRIGPTPLRSMAGGITSNYDKYTNSQTPNQNVPTSPKSDIARNPTYAPILKLQKFLKSIGDEYYGKQFMVSIPSPQYWTDTSTGLIGYNTSIQIGTTNSGAPIMLTSGSAKTYYQYEPTDSAWEEPYNVIDDTLVIGSPNVYPLTNDDGSIKPIVGYDNNYQFNYSGFADAIKFLNSRLKPQNRDLIEFYKWDYFHRTGFGAVNGDSFVNSVVPTMSQPNSFFVPSLSLDNNNSDTCTIVNYPTAAQNAGAGFGPAATDAYDNRPVPQNLMSKIYKAAEVDKNYASHFVPLLTSGGSIVPKIIVKTDGCFLNPMYPSQLSVRAAAADFLAHDYNAFGDQNLINRVQKVLSANPLFGSQNTENQQFDNLSIHPKAAIPNFIAVPMLLNDAVYGPWISAPDLNINNIFPNDNDIERKKRKLENLAGGVNVEINSDLVPWNYGGMRVLDEAAILLANDNNDYQTKAETGQLSIYGVPNIWLGSQLYAAGANNGPIINNVQVQVGENGPLTTYTLRTFTRKFTLFNKENADRLKTISQNSIRLNKEFTSRFNKISARLRDLERNAGTNDDGDSSKLMEYSPMTIMVGYSAPYISPKQTISRGFFPVLGDNSALWTGDSVKQKTNVGIQELREVVQEYNSNYSLKSFMSMDGIFHPVSFYPTPGGSTTAYKRYFTSGCQFCGGTKNIQITLNDGSTTNIWCDYCNTEPAGKEINEKGIAGSAPPFILSNSVSADIINNPNAVSQLLKDTLLVKRINYINLNPIIMPVGELRNKYAQDNDFTAHSIEAIGRSQVPMAGSLSVSDNLNIDQDGLEYYDQNRFDSDGDWNSRAFDQFIGRNNNVLQMNHRFMALRGPLVIAGWGFDTEGYPVPNASGEPKNINGQGYPKRIASPGDPDGGYQNYQGTILGKNQEWDANEGKWTDPYKESNFYKGWGLRPDLWPVGPVDLRWDNNRKVWTCPVPYKIVDIELEDNLIPPFPARGFLYKYDKESPLPQNTRRLVFVKDSADVFGAPRGARLTCYYDESSGFYEVINKQNIIAKGNITGNGFANIITAYAADDANTITVEFENFLGFSISSSNQPGIFSWMKDRWVLISTNSCG